MRTPSNPSAPGPPSSRPRARVRLPRQGPLAATARGGMFACEQGTAARRPADHGLPNQAGKAQIWRGSGDHHLDSGGETKLTRSSTRGGARHLTSAPRVTIGPFRCETSTCSHANAVAWPPDPGCLDPAWWPSVTRIGAVRSDVARSGRTASITPDALGVTTSGRHENCGASRKSGCSHANTNEAEPPACSPGDERDRQRSAVDGPARARSGTLDQEAGRYPRVSAREGVGPRSHANTPSAHRGDDRLEG